ncbi:putative virion structural protein [Erwinia phage vB_EamM_ChrisDB]|uniref:putative virion structural protein n=1 Tax=Erwinia phage vB_EamM_ChrisDB TaxID=1883371 RepID=UPI00081C5622|nr:putative virion structural protein [Erwinia phage vB_EamM_ChrisDB]ANZ48755.1 putative virion structural protein [Erwinia phage vB_EamM_ChrisDB]
MDAIYQVRADSAYGFNRESRTWETIDVTQPLKTLYATYHSFEVGLESLGLLYTLHSQDYKADIQNRTGTLQDWLDSKAGVALTLLTDGLPVLEFSHAHWQSLNANVGPEAYICPPNYHYTQDFALEDAHDVVIVSEADRDVLRNNALYCINGQWVPSGADSVGVRLPGAGNIVRRTGYLDIGCLVFNDIGNVQTIPIKGLTLSKLDTSRDYNSTLLLTLPTSITGKKVGYVIGGILHWLKPEFYFSDKAIMLSLPNFSLVKTVLETRDYYDWDSIGVGDLSTATLVSRIRNPETMKALLEHESSFIVVVDNPYLEFEHIGINHGASYGRFHLRDPNDIDSEKPLGMLNNEFGKTVSYWPTWQEGEWTFHTTEITRQNYLFSHAKWQNQNAITDVKPIVAPSPYRVINVEMVRIKARKK